MEATVTKKTGGKQALAPSQQADLLKKYRTGGHTMQGLADLFSCGIGTIHRMLSPYKEKGIHGYRKYGLREGVFTEIDNAKKAYFLGFLFADGNVYPPTNTVTLAIHKDDESMLRTFAAFMGMHTVPRMDNTNNPNLRQLRFTSKQAIDDLRDKGLVANKTYTDTLPSNIPDRLMGAFARGNLDGDGCVSFNPDTEKACVYFLGRESFLSWLGAWFTGKGLTYSILPCVGHYRMRIKYGSFKKLYALLYSDNAPRLLRKQGKFEAILQAKSQMYANK